MAQTELLVDLRKVFITVEQILFLSQCLMKY